jgi:hypothetical protein
MTEVKCPLCKTLLSKHTISPCLADLRYLVTGEFHREEGYYTKEESEMEYG